MIEFKKITHKNFKECLELEVSKEQIGFVLDNKYSLAEAYALTNDERGFIPMPFGIYDNDVLIGFFMLIYKPKNTNDICNENVYFLARFMISEKYQGKGYGKSSILKIIEFVKTFPCGVASSIVLSFYPENIPAKNLYTSLGFYKTNMMDDENDPYYVFDL